MRYIVALQIPEFIDKDVVLSIHEYLIERYGGSSGIRDPGLLESALAQPQATFFGEFLHPTIADQAAAYLYHIAKNHPFVDGNKRTGFGVMEAFLRLNGYTLDFSDAEAYDIVLKVAKGELEKAELSELLKTQLIKTSAD